MEDVIERLKKFVLAHPEMSKSGFIQGLDKTGKVVIIVNGQEKRITIDELENGHLNQTSTKEELNTQMKEPQPISNQMSAPVLTSEKDEEIEEIEQMDEPISSATDEINNLKDFQTAVLSKNEYLVNKALEKFAIDDKTGSINMNKAIKIVTDNCINNVVSAYRDNTVLESDLSKYDVTSKPLVPFQNNDVKEELTSLINKSFNNILVFVEAARLKNIVYNEAQIEAAKKKYAIGVQDKINVLGLNKKEEITPDMVKEQPKAMTLDLQPDKNIKKAGFADILILTIIVLIYAAIIVNLITKLK